MKREKHITFTYSGKATIRRAAIKKAKKEGMNFSELVEMLLTQYANEPKNMGVYENFVEATTIK